MGGALSALSVAASPGAAPRPEVGGLQSCRFTYRSWCEMETVVRLFMERVS